MIAAKQTYKFHLMQLHHLCEKIKHDRILSATNRKQIFTSNVLEYMKYLETVVTDDTTDLELIKALDDNLVKFRDQIQNDYNIHYMNRFFLYLSLSFFIFGVFDRISCFSLEKIERLRYGESRIF